MAAEKIVSLMDSPSDERMKLDDFCSKKNHGIHILYMLMPVLITANFNLKLGVQ
jgi:hypothetical protein